MWSWVKSARSRRTPPWSCACKRGSRLDTTGCAGEGLPLRVGLGGTPPLSIKSRKSNPSPAQPVVSNRLPRLHAHDHGGVLLDLADFTQLHIIGEAAHQRGTEAGAAQITGAKARKKEKQRTSQEDGSRGHTQSGQTQRASQPPIAR